jgi:HflK protein
VEDSSARAFEYAQREWRWLWKPVLVSLALLWVASGTYVLKPEETAVVQRFGRKLLPYRGPGLHYALPWPIENVNRIDAGRVRVMELGFRTLRPQKQSVEPAAYEWNVAHSTGRYVQNLDEALMLTGDQNLVTTNAVVQYTIDRPDDYLFHLADPEGTLRGVAESSIRSVFGTGELDVLLTTGRAALEARAREEMQKRVERYGAGIRVLSVRLQDVHPPLEVVDAFREVSTAFEEKNRLINEAEAYRNEQIALARGQAASRIEEARGYLVRRTNRASGDAQHFLQSEAAYRSAPGPTETRLFLESMEQVLPGRNKLILETNGKGKRQLLTVDSQSLRVLMPNLEQQTQPVPQSLVPKD